MKNTMKTLACAALVLAMTTGLAACGAAPAVSAPASEAAPAITVSASGTVRLVPDKATVSFGVTTQEPTAEEAQRKNSEAVNHVIEVLTGRGVEEKSIRTERYNMYPQYDWSEAKGQTIIGYSVTTTMSVQDQDIEGLGDLLSACVAAGINDVDSIRFLCSGYDEAYAKALTQAVEASRDKAGTLAAAAGKKLGDPISITEGWQDSSARYGKNVNASLAREEMAAMDSAAPVLQPGETEITANVTVSYEMQ